MTDTDLKTRLDLAVKRRDSLAQQRQRALGRLEEAERALEDLRAKCRAKNLDPDNLNAVIDRMTVALSQSVGNLEVKLTEAETALAPYINRK
jgi:chromosome segregation ATPase